MGEENKAPFRYESITCDKNMWSAREEVMDVVEPSTATTIWITR